MTDARRSRFSRIRQHHESSFVVVNLFFVMFHSFLIRYNSATKVGCPTKDLGFEDLSLWERRYL